MHYQNCKTNKSANKKCFHKYSQAGSHNCSLDDKSLMFETLARTQAWNGK